MQSSKIEILVAARRVANFAKELGADIDSRDLRPTYDHMGALLADSVLQAGLNYNSVVLPRITRILSNYPEHNRVSTLVDLVRQGGTGSFLNWSHVEKTARFDALTGFLSDRAVDVVADLRRQLADRAFSTALLNVRGIGPKTVDYMGCLVGIDSIAVDRHVKTFAKRVGVLQNDYEFLKLVFCYAADLLSVSRRAFDAWVWRRESSLSARQLSLPLLSSEA